MFAESGTACRPVLLQSLLHTLSPVASLHEAPAMQVRMLDEAETTLTSIDQASERLVQNVLKQAQTAKPSYG